MSSLDPVDLADVLARWEAGSLGPAPAAPADVDELRHDLEAAAARAVDAAGDADLGANPIRLSKHRITQLAACERHLVATAGDDGPGGDPTALHLGILVDVLAEHHVLTARSHPAPEPLTLGAELCRAHGDKQATLDWLDGLAPGARAAVAELLGEKHAGLLGDWPTFDPRWWPRTQERAVVALAGGQVVLDGRADAVVGGAPTAWPALVIEVKSGAFTQDQRDDGLFYGLLLALRDGQAPAAAVTTSPTTVHVDVGSADRLRTAGRRLAAAIVAAGELAGRRAPRELAGGRCERCPDRRRCPTGATWEPRR